MAHKQRVKKGLKLFLLQKFTVHSLWNNKLQILHIAIFNRPKILHSFNGIPIIWVSQNVSQYCNIYSGDCKVCPQLLMPNW